MVQLLKSGSSSGVQLLGLSLALLCALTSSLVAGDNNSQTPPEFLLRNIHGQQYRGQIMAIAPDWTCQLKSGQRVNVAGKSLLSVSQPDQPSPSFPPGPQFILTDGQRLSFTLKDGLELVAGKFRITPQEPLSTSSMNGVFGIPRAVVSVLWLGSEHPLHPELAIRKLINRKRKTDEVHLRNGDTLEGTFVSLNGESGCKIRVQQKTLTIPWASLRAVAFRSDLLIQWPSKQPLARAVLSNGSRLVLSSPKLTESGHHLLAQSPWTTEKWRIALTDVVALDFQETNAVPLSDLQPAGYEHTAFFGVPVPYVLDGSVNGEALTIGTSTYSRGIGLSCGSELRFRLDGKYHWFDTLIGMDGKTGQKGQAVLSLVLDGKVVDVLDRKLWDASKGSRQVRVNVQGIQELMLKVEYGANGNVHGDVNWANPVLIPGP